jgi:hypothetical protein
MTNATNQSCFYDYVDSFNKNKRTFVALITSGRNGSNLLQSLFDSHSTVLMIPTLFWYYDDWRKLFKNDFIKVYEIDQFLEESSWRMDWYVKGLGEDRNQSVVIDRSSIKIIAKEILSGKDCVSRKELLLLIHYAYSLIRFGRLMDHTVLLFHNHFPFSSITTDYFSSNKNLQIPVKDQIDELFSDFPGAKVIHTIRNPYSAYISGFDADLERFKPLDIRQYLFQTLALLSGVSLALKRLHDQRYSKSYYIVKYEDLHIDTPNTMLKLSNFLGISYEVSMLKSTFDGLKWWGNNHDKPFSGTSEKFVRPVNLFKLSMITSNSLWLCLDRLSSALGYDLLERPIYIKRTFHILCCRLRLILGWSYCLLKTIFSQRRSICSSEFKFLIAYRKHWKCILTTYSNL